MFSVGNYWDILTEDKIGVIYYVGFDCRLQWYLIEHTSKFCKYFRTGIKKKGDVW